MKISVSPLSCLSSPRRRGSSFFLTFLWIPAFAGMTSGGLADISIENPWIRAGAGPNAALFMTIANPHEKLEKLTHATIEGCQHAELHTHIEENGVYKMREVKFIEVPPLGSQELKPGGHHVMLIKIHAPLQEGDEIPVTLLFEGGESIQFEAPVKKRAGECCGQSE